MAKRLCLVVLMACGSGGGFPDAPLPDAPPPSGSVSVDWAVTDQNAAPITCEQIGGVSVTLEMHNRNVNGGTTEVFACGSMTGMTSQELIPGTYDIQFHLVGKNGVNLADAAPQQGIVVTGGQNTKLTALSFAVQATGGVQLQLNTLRADGNCAATGATGGNITAMSITLIDTDSGNCAPVTFDIQPSGTTYTVNCTTPVLGPCIEHDQTLTATGLASGSYQIHIVGQEAATTCWTNNDTFQVPALDATFMETVNLGFATGTTGCQ